MTKIIAFNLPQYYSFKENDEWWGKGFTDWCNVRKAKPLFEGHNQPRKPLEGYYNMLDHHTHVRQAELAKNYGIYGFCYYHYWFNGKLLMEKPLELILNEKDVDLPFCMCWANEPFTRSWNGKNKEIIMPQFYGDKNDWLSHIRYLIPFFKDPRYIKVDDMPLFVLYRSNNIENCEDIISLWDEECKKQGFKGIYIIEERNNFQNKAVCSNSKATLDFEPNYTREIDKTIVDRAKNKIDSKFGKGFLTWSYEKVCKSIVNRRNVDKTKIHYRGMFVGWDNSPRRKKGGSIALGSTPKVFEKYLQMQIQMSQLECSDFIFLNAWNEWAEGAYLEPDEHFGFGYLDAVKRAIQEY